MAKKAASPNAKLIESLQSPKPIPYDPELMEALAEADRRAWNEFNRLRVEVYRDALPWYGLAMGEAWKDPDLEKQVQLRADREWTEKMGVPAITSSPNLDIVRAAATAAGYPPTEAGLRAWTISKPVSPAKTGMTPDPDTYAVILEIRREPSNQKVYDKLGPAVAKSVDNVKNIRSRDKKLKYNV